ncbi:hypothetical protein [Streptomyces sp. NPDC057579]|uniref:hypothetical protein n=1 Tax=Streptomyces sp. NPDC057579 TaxID=3346172 RepID=UPI00368706D7
MGWTSVSKLSLVLDTGEQQGETVSGALGAIGVVISVQPTDDDGNPVDVKATVLLAKAELIDYVDETQLSLGKDTSKEHPWCCEKDEKFTTKSKIPQIKWSVSHFSTPKPLTKSIGVQITTDSGKTFYSSLNGTYHSAVWIKALK